MDFEPIQNRCVFVTSGGRTGTLFFSRLFKRILPDCHSVHEPDLMHLRQPILGWDDEESWAFKLRTFGVFNSTLGKLTSHGNLRRLSLERQKGKVRPGEAAQILHRLRYRYIQAHCGKVYVESNLQLMGLIDIIPQVFPNSKTLFIARDGREWVRSWMNWTQPLYGKNDLFAYLKSGRASAEMFANDPFHHVWGNFSQFQKVCWLWQFHVSYALQTIAQDSFSRVVRFEDIFEKEDRNETMKSLLDFIFAFPDGKKTSYNWNPAWLDKKIHQSTQSQFPGWQDWTPEQTRQFHAICSEPFYRLGYGQEKEWMEKLPQFDDGLYDNLIKASPLLAPAK